MTNPLTTPTGIPRSTPIPRSPDGSPMPKARASQLRGKRLAEELVPDVEVVEAAPPVYANPARPEGPDGWGPGPRPAVDDVDGVVHGDFEVAYGKEATDQMPHGTVDITPEIPVKPKPVKKAAPKPPVTP